MRSGQPSKTARKVALNVVTLGAKPGMDDILPVGIVNATKTLLVKSGAVDAKAVRFAGSKTAVWIYKAFDWMMPGQFEAFGHRKAFCESQVREGIEAGASHVLVLGAGYDTLGWRLAPEFTAVNFFEIDHPATVRLKAQGIEAMGKPENLHLIPENLGERRLVDVLSAIDVWDQTAQTVILAEGLLMYLPPDAVRALFDQCAQMTGTGSRMAFTYIGSRADGRPDAGPWTKLVLWILKIYGEPWLWSVPPEELSMFLKPQGWDLAPKVNSSARSSGVEFFAVAVK